MVFMNKKIWKNINSNNAKCQIARGPKSHSESFPELYEANIRYNFNTLKRITAVWIPIAEKKKRS